MSRDLESAVRAAASALRAAIAEAEAAGLVVTLPRKPADLDSILISETAAAQAPQIGEADGIVKEPISFPADGEEHEADLAPAPAGKRRRPLLG